MPVVYAATGTFQTDVIYGTDSSPIASPGNVQWPLSPRMNIPGGLLGSSDTAVTMATGWLAYAWQVVEYDLLVRGVQVDSHFPLTFDASTVGGTYATIAALWLSTTGATNLHLRFFVSYAGP